jgi:hypothetical protein
MGVNSLYSVKPLRSNLVIFPLYPFTSQYIILLYPSNPAIKNHSFKHITSNVGKTMPCLPSPSHHHKYIGGIYKPFPVMGGKNGIAAYPHGGFLNNNIPKSSIYRWDFPSHKPIFIGIFHHINQPKIWGSPDGKLPHSNHPSIFSPFVAVAVWRMDPSVPRSNWCDWRWWKMIRPWRRRGHLFAKGGDVPSWTYCWRGNIVFRCIYMYLWGYTANKLISHQTRRIYFDSGGVVT